MSDVFVSYTAVDRALALPIVQLLQDRKLRVFWDREIPAGKKWQNVLEHQLKRAKCVVVLLTQESLKSSWVTFEASIALERRIIVPVILDSQLDPQNDLPEMYRDLHVVSLSTASSHSNATTSNAVWIQTIVDTVKHSARRQSLQIAAAVSAAFLIIVALAYIALTGHNALTMWQAGLRYVERGAFSKEENERLQSAIRNATTIDILAPNATNFTSAFRDDLPVFLKSRPCKTSATRMTASFLG